MSRYFTLKELLATNTDAPNFPQTWEEIENLQKLSARLDFIRAKCCFPIRVNSGYRSEEVNRLVGGVATSAHRLGLAADICSYHGNEAENNTLFSVCKQLINKLHIDQLIVYRKDNRIRFLHVGFKANDADAREQILYK